MPPPLTADQKRGKTFERKVGRALTRAVGQAPAWLGLQLFPNAWIHFRDRSGYGWAQPDFYILAPACILLYECKLTERDGVDLEMTGLYAPLLAFIYKRPIVRVGVFKFLKSPPIRPISGPLEPLAEPRELFHTWHYGAPAL